MTIKSYLSAIAKQCLLLRSCHAYSLVRNDRAEASLANLSKESFNSQAKVILEGARRISKQLDSPNIRQAHCLLSIIDSEGIGIRTLENLGVNFKLLEEDVQKLMKLAD